MDDDEYQLLNKSSHWYVYLYLLLIDIFFLFLIQEFVKTGEFTYEKEDQMIKELYVVPINFIYILF